MESKYNNFISQFEILYNPPEKEGFHRHHIVPKSEQVELDNRQVYLLPSQHLWAHVLYDQEHGTNTVSRLRSTSKIQPSCYEDCLPFDEIERERIEKTSRANKGRPLSEETKKRMSISRTGERNPLYGRTLPDEVKMKLSETHINHPKLSKKVRQYTLEGVFIKEYPSLSEAERQIKVSHTQISSCCKGVLGYKSAGGFIWKYA